MSCSFSGRLASVCHPTLFAPSFHIYETNIPMRWRLKWKRKLRTDKIARFHGLRRANLKSEAAGFASVPWEHRLRADSAYALRDQLSTINITTENCCRNRVRRELFTESEQNFLAAKSSGGVTMAYAGGVLHRGSSSEHAEIADELRNTNKSCLPWVLRKRRCRFHFVTFLIISTEEFLWSSMADIGCVL